VIFEAVADIKERWLVLIGDGLTVQRILQFREKLGPKETTFIDNYEQVKSIGKALEHIAVCPGDLHGGGFHFLQPIYDIFFQPSSNQFNANSNGKVLSIATFRNHTRWRSTS
jgi:hypothetical protein